MSAGVCASVSPGYDTESCPAQNCHIMAQEMGLRGVSSAAGELLDSGVFSEPV